MNFGEGMSLKTNFQVVTLMSLTMTSLRVRALMKVCIDNTRKVATTNCLSEGTEFQMDDLKGNERQEGEDEFSDDEESASNS
jgi:hypothetical protein